MDFESPKLEKCLECRYLNFDLLTAATLRGILARNKEALKNFIKSKSRQ